MQIIKRDIKERIESLLFRGRIIIIYGARQVGKTTLIKEIQKKFDKNSIYFNCDEPDIREAFTNRTSTELKNLIGNKKLLFIDEAQRVRNIGITLKLINDNFKETQIIATGSSSFDLSNEVSEPLTGRKFEFIIYPFSINELMEIYSSTEIDRLLETRILKGMYPDVVLQEENSNLILKDITKSYLYRDVLQYQNIKNPDILNRLLQALALQIGNEVSYNELGNLISIDKKTVANYIELLEKSFIIFRLSPFNRNLRSELTKLRKIYFIDTGIRNALINNFNSLKLRNDTGNLWENFLISERIKINNNKGYEVNTYFWRTHQQHEIDYLEETAGKLKAFEIKWGKFKHGKGKNLFIKTYTESEFELINNKNYKNFIY